MYPIARSVIVALGWTGASFVFFAAGLASASSGESLLTDVVTVDFRGGTLAGYVEAIRQATDGANIVITAVDAQEIPVAAIKLDGVSVESALRLVEQTYPVDDREWLDVRLQTVGPPSQPGKPVYRLRAVRSSAKVWNVLDMFACKMRPADVLTAVDAAVELIVENDQPARVRFHESTGVLIATGTPRQVNAIGDVVERLRDQLRLTQVREVVERAAAASEGGPSMTDEIAVQLRRIEGRIDKLERRIDQELLKRPGGQVSSHEGEYP